MLLTFTTVASISLLLAAANAAEVTKLSPSQLERIGTHALHETEERSPLWIVRFVVPWEDTEKEAAAFADAAKQVSDVIAQFATFDVDSLDAIAMTDALQIVSFPTIRAFGARLGRPQVPKGALQTPRVVRFDLTNVFGGSRIDANQIVNWVLLATPTRYEQPVTGAVLPTVARVHSLSELKAAVSSLKPQTPVIVFFGNLASTPLTTLATLNSQGARLRDRSVIIFCSSSPLAREFGVSLGTDEAGASAVVFRDTQHGDHLVPSLKREGLKTPESIADFLSEHSTPFDAYQAAVNNELDRWQSDVAQYISSSPLRRLDSLEQFTSEILDVKHSVGIIFLLRESDKFFSLHEQVAVSVAKFQTEYHHVSLVTGEPLSTRMPCSIFWLDAEVHPDMAKALGATQVPSIAVILPLKDGMFGVKFFVDGKSFPSADQVNRFTQSEQLIDTKEVRPLNVDGLRFSAKLPNRRAEGDAANKQYLNVDHRDYRSDPEPPNLIQDAIAAAEEAAKENAQQTKKPLSAKAEQRKAAAEEARKEKVRVELERKRLEREERMRAKAEKDAADRVAKAAEAAKKREEEEQLKKSAPQEPKPKKKAKKKTPKPTARKQKPPRDLMEELMRWEAESRLMAAKYVKVSPDGKSVSIIHSLSPPSP